MYGSISRWATIGAASMLLFSAAAWSGPVPGDASAGDTGAPPPGERSGGEPAEAVIPSIGPPQAPVSQRLQALDLSIDVTQVLTPEQLRVALAGGNDVAGPGDPATQQMEQIEVRAFREQQEDALHSRIPFGFAAIAWAFSNPAEAWRLFVPISEG